MESQKNQEYALGGSSSFEWRYSMGQNWLERGDGWSMGSDQEDALVKEEWRGKDEENPGFPCLVTFAEKIKPHLESKSSESNEIIFKNVSREHATKKNGHTHTHTPSL